MSVNNSTAAPPEEGRLLVNQFDLVTSTTVAGTLYGVALTLFCLYVYSLGRRIRSEDRKGQARFMLGYSCIIMLCGLYLLITDAWSVQDAYIKHNNYPGGPYSYENSTLHTPAVIIVFSCLLIIDVLTSAIQIWRVWVVWGATKYANFAIILPLLGFLTFIPLRVRTQILQATKSELEALQDDDKTRPVAYIVQGVVTVLCTLFISLYLIFRHWRQRKLIGKAQGSIGYMGVVAVLIESYVLESVWLLITAVTWKESISIFFGDSAPYIEIISYLLVQYRVANRTAYESQRIQKNMSSLRWNHEDHITTRSGEINGRFSGPPMRMQEEATEVSPVSSLA